MISIWVDDAGPHGIANYFSGRGAALSERFALRLYDWSETTLQVPGGAQIFGSLDQLTPSGREAVATIYDQLAAQWPGVPLLNDPRRALLRTELLATLSEQGLNRFGVHLAVAPETATKFPVFVREASGHTGTLTGLLHSRTELRRALRSLRVRGHRPVDLLVVEYCHTADPEGRFRKYAAFKVGPAILPCHLLVGPQWMMKAEGGLKTLELAHEEMAYITDNPHAAWLKRVFDLAGVGYGRIDYGVLDGVPQAWEINLNPTLGRRPGAPPLEVAPEIAKVRERSREIFHSQLRDAFLALEPASAPASVRVTLAPSLLARIAREYAQHQRHRARVDRVTGLYARLPFAGLLKRLFPRR